MSHLSDIAKNQAPLQILTTNTLTRNRFHTITPLQTTQLAHNNITNVINPFIGY